VPNEYVARAEVAPGQPFVNFHFHSPTLARLVLHQINQLNYLEAPQDAPAVRSEAETDGKEVSQPSASSSSAAPPASSVVGVDRGYGTNTRGLGKKVLIDFSSPNIAKPFHAGHLRSTIIGMFTANVYTANGWKAIKMNYLGDWGKQYGLLAVGFERHGSEENLKNDPIKHLFDVYVKVNDDARDEVKSIVQKRREEQLASGEKVMVENDKGEQVELTLDMETTRTEKEYAELNSPTHNAARALFRKMEEGEPEALAIWKRFRDLSIAKYKEIYKRLNIEFDIYWGESQVKPQSQKDAVEELQKLGLVYEDKGALLCKLDKKLGKVLIMKGDGAALYMTRDIGGALERWNEYHFDKVRPCIGLSLLSIYANKCASH
jgi:arginyl-tRNA synthetase